MEIRCVAKGKYLVTKARSIVTGTEGHQFFFFSDLNLSLEQEGKETISG